MALGWAGKPQGETELGRKMGFRAETGNNSNGYHFLNICTMYMLMLYWPGRTLCSCGEEFDNDFPPVYLLALGICSPSSVNRGEIPCIFLQPQIYSETSPSHKTEEPGTLTAPPIPSLRLEAAKT